MFGYPVHSITFAFTMYMPKRENSVPVRNNVGGILGKVTIRKFGKV